jgi:hypothetical protein
MSKILATLLAGAALSLAGSKDRDWQMGKVLDPIYNQYFDRDATAKGLGDSLFGTAYRTGASAADSASVSDTYVIETEDTVYRVERVRLKVSTEAKVKKYTKIRFSIDKDRLWIEDSDGKQWSTKILDKKPRNI